MNKKDFIAKMPYLYHLTDPRNLICIKNEGTLYSTVEIIKVADIHGGNEFLKQRRPEHRIVDFNKYKIHLRDQRPLNRALEKCLTHNWKPEQFIFHLNSRVFMWPTIKRLRIHYGRYANENPIILRFSTKEILELNHHAEITHINSGATRPSGALGGKAASRGKNTFKKFEVFDMTISKVAEVTFPAQCILPKVFQSGTSPEGPWIQVQ